MSDKRFSVEEWPDDVLQAAQIGVGGCCHGDTIGINMLAQDGSVLAHGHFDLQTAVRFARHFLKVLEEAAAKQRRH